MNKLPPEILQYVFRLATRQDKVKPYSLNDASIEAGDIWALVEPTLSGATAIVSVCRRWRSVFLADATFWYLIQDRQDQRPLTIARQSSAALELRLLSTPSHAVRKLLESAGHRVRAIQWEKANARRTDLGLLATPGCRLEKLVLSTSPHLPVVGADMLTPILHTQTTYLQRLTLRDCSALPNAFLPKLVGLHLDNCLGAVAGSALYDLLVHAPKLTDLVLSRVHLADGAETSYVRTPLPLPHLRRIVFAEGVPSESVAAFLRRVDLSPDASIRIHADPHPSLFTGLMRTPAFRDATNVYLSSDRGGVILTGPNAAVHFAIPDAFHAVLRHVSASVGLRIAEVWLLGEVGRGAGLPAFPRRVKKVVVYDVGLAAALDAVQRGGTSVDGAKADLRPNPDYRPVDGQREGTAVHVLMTRFMSVNAVLSKLAGWEEAQTTHVVVGCLPTYKGDRACPPGFEHAFASLEITDHVEEPKPALPDVCTKMEHWLWPVWLE